MVTILRYWKELILVAMTIGTGILIVRDALIRQRILSDKFAWLLVLFTLIHSTVYLVFGGAPFDSILGLKINLSFLLLYLILSATQIYTKITQLTLLYIVLIPSGIVGLFGALQTFVLPHNILTHFGYGPLGGSNPAYYLIENSQTIRVMSTLWGPNQFGSYLVLPLTLSLWWLFKGIGRQKVFAGLVFTLDLLSLYGSQSRGAWLAAVIAIGFVVVLLSRGWTRWAALFTSIAIVASIIILAINHKFPQKINMLLLHGASLSNNLDTNTSNGGHLKALTLGFERLQAHPLGAGLEAAGRASENSSEQLYTENFFLQLAVQIGYEGLLVFTAISGLIAWRLISGLHLSPLNLPLLASFIGLSINNLVAHTWSDGATAWIWWGLAGVVFAQTKLARKANNVKA